MSSSAALQQIDIIKIYEKKRCLVVDDITEVRAAYKRMLRSFGVLEIDTAATGDQAMQMCQSRQYGMIICDYNLDDSKDGQQVLEELRHMGLLKYTTLFIIITAESSREMVLGAIENQPDDYITKPISQKMMRSRLDRALIKHEALYQVKAAMDSKSYSRAIRLCDEMIKAGSRYRWECVRYKAQIYWLMGDSDSARAIYEAVLQEKEFVWAKLGLAKALLQSEQYDNIEPILKGILRDDHRYIEAHDILSDFYQKTRQFEKAQAAVETATHLSPKSILRHRKLAQLAEANQNDEVCLKAYEEAVRWNYNSCHADAEDYLGLARKTVSLTRGRKDREAIDKSKKALSLLERMLKRFPEIKNIVKSNLIEAQLHANQGKVNLAKSALEKAEQNYEQLEIKEVNTRLDYASTHLVCGDRKKAYKELHLLAKDNKDNKQVLNRIDKISEEPITVVGKQCASDLSRSGISAYQNKEYDKSLGIFKEALKMFPNHVGVNLNLVQVALAKIESSDIDKELLNDCEKSLARVVSIEPEHKQYKRFIFLSDQYNKVKENFSQKIT